jgi:hypothetical protein
MGAHTPGLDACVFYGTVSVLYTHDVHRPPLRRSRRQQPGPRLHTSAHTLTSMHTHTQATSSSPPPATRTATSTAAARPTPPRTPTATSSAWARSTGTTNRARRSPTTVRADEPPSAYSRSACRAAGWWLPSPHKAVLGLEGPCWSTARQSPALITQTPSLHAHTRAATDRARAPPACSLSLPGRSNVDLFAPGENIYSTVLSGGGFNYDGYEGELRGSSLDGVRPVAHL